MVHSAGSAACAGPASSSEVDARAAVASPATAVRLIIVDLLSDLLPGEEGAPLTLRVVSDQCAALTGSEGGLVREEEFVPGRHQESYTPDLKH
ncbi:hypothetical protein Kisp02_72990 [Kineosporia sp. NBRC 101731]|nr:hypothetical protein Kisp02_72990 [Kineosporia sp. NBRC 101731]